jgi:hypothetical protein
MTAALLTGRNGQKISVTALDFHAAASVPAGQEVLVHPRGIWRILTCGLMYPEFIPDADGGVETLVTYKNGASVRVKEAPEQVNEAMGNVFKCSFQPG